MVVRIKEKSVGNKVINSELREVKLVGTILVIFQLVQFEL